MYLAVDKNVQDVFELRVIVPLNHPRARELEWMAPDAPIPSDTRKIPQRSGPWHRLRSTKFSGTKAYMAIGYFADKKQPMNAFQKRAMRNGVMAEPYAVLSYLEHFDRAVYYEVGFSCAPSPPYPSNWGASPDGYIENPEMSWDQLPEDVARHLNPDEWDVRRGCIEIKTTTSQNLNLEPYYLPQVYMEMISLGVLWCDVIRYRVGVRSDRVAMGDTANVFRVFRHKPTEDKLVELWKQPSPSPASETMRAHLERLVGLIPAIARLTPSNELLTRYYTERLSLLSSSPPPTPQPSSDGELTILLERMHKRSLQLLGAPNRATMQKLLLLQLSDCSEALNELLL
jgi:hypothetical protein